LSALVSRRQFLEAAAIGGSGARSLAAVGTMPTRILGRTGVSVSMLTFGAGSRFLKLKREPSIAMLHRALDLGINVVDTGENYGDGESESRIGEVLRTRRREVFLATKLGQRDADGALRAMEGSLKRLRTDQVDLVHIHHLDGADDLAKVSAKGGAYEAVTRIRDQKMARFIGITSHSDPETLRAALERHDFDCTQMALNAARAGMQNGKGGMVLNADLKTSFEDVALPVARSKKMGVIAMKIFAQETLVGQAPPEKLLYYSLSLPGVTLAVAGMPKFEFIDQNVALAKAFKPLPPAEMRQLSTGLAARNKVALDRFFSTHVDA
jgi:aryl-alcohol dehydrogenase-like predicted oxidoreductase